MPATFYLHTSVKAHGYLRVPVMFENNNSEQVTHLAAWDVPLMSGVSMTTSTTDASILGI